MSTCKPSAIVLPPGSLTETQAAEFLGIDKTSLQGLRTLRRGPFWTKIGTRISYTIAALKRWQRDQDLVNWHSERSYPKSEPVKVQSNHNEAALYLIDRERFTDEGTARRRAEELAEEQDRPITVFVKIADRKRVACFTASPEGVLQ